MNSPINLNCPINALSLGAVSFGLLREAKRRGWTPSVIPIGNVDLSGQKPDPEFNAWLQVCLNNGVTKHSRSTPAIRVWHLNGSYDSVSEKSLLLTFWETDSPTEAEINVVRQNKHVFLATQFGVQCFKNFGIDNIHYLPLGCDTHNFYPLNKKYFNNRTVWMICGKQELRKATLQTIKCWLAKYGNHKDHVLHVSCQNPFLLERRPDGQVVDHGMMEISQMLAGQKYFNINFYPFLDSVSFNDFYNAGNILIDGSGGESPGYGAMTALQLGKHVICTQAHSFSTMYTDKEVTWLKPTGKRSVIDGKFFLPNSPFNAGSFFAWQDEAFGVACDLAMKRVQENPINQPGIDLMKTFNWERTMDEIIKYVQN